MSEPIQFQFTVESIKIKDGEAKVSILIPQTDLDKAMALAKHDDCLFGASVMVIDRDEQ